MIKHDIFFIIWKKIQTTLLCVKIHFKIRKIEEISKIFENFLKNLKYLQTMVQLFFA